VSARTADGYIRVSRRAGREGESFISPEVQRRKIADWAALHEVEILAWWEEIDQSGAKLERPMFQQALQRCERGESGGIVVARLDRFARSAVDALESIRRLNQAGARLVSVEDNFDGSTAMGRFAIGILTLIAELELERIRENWSTATSEAVARGVHISARPPTGYQRGPDGRLVIDETAAPHIREAFRLRANGASWAEIAHYLEQHGVRSSRGSPSWSKTGVASLIGNPVYLGQARSGSIVNQHAHQPIVTRAEWDAAQSTTKALLKPRDGSVASQAMLGGIARCAGCGHTLKITGNTDKKTGQRYPVYYCTGRYASGPCPARASIRASYLDSYVEAQVHAALQAEGGLIAQATKASTQIEQAARAVQDAEHELDLYIQNPTLLTTLGEARFLQGAQARQTHLDHAHQTLSHLRHQTNLASEIADGNLLTAWPTLTNQEKRRLMHGLLDQVTVTRAAGRGRQTQPIADRTLIILRGGSPLTPASARPPI
jgi:site-specific DNA recombinase